MLRRRSRMDGRVILLFLGIGIINVSAHMKNINAYANSAIIEEKSKKIKITWRTSEK